MAIGHLFRIVENAKYYVIHGCFGVASGRVPCNTRVLLLIVHGMDIFII